jgi:hypothetical protein
MRKTVFCFAIAAVVIALVFASCKHRVDVYPHAPKEPIVVRVEVHIYEHAVSDVGYITGESPLEGTTEEKPPAASEGEKKKTSNLFLRLLGIGVAYADTASDQSQLKQVLDSMRKRYPTLSRYKADRSVGENHLGYVEERPSPKMSDAKYAKAVRATIAAENPDRRLLYELRARLDGTTPAKQAIIYARVWQRSAKPGEWIEVLVEKKWVWKQK